MCCLGGGAIVTVGAVVVATKRPVKCMAQAVRHCRVSGWALCPRADGHLDACAGQESHRCMGQNAGVPGVVFSADIQQPTNQVRVALANRNTPAGAGGVDRKGKRSDAVPDHVRVLDGSSSE